MSIKWFLTFLDYIQGIKEIIFLFHMKYALSPQQAHVRALKNRIIRLFVFFCLVPSVVFWVLLYRFYNHASFAFFSKGIFAFSGGVAFLFGTMTVCSIIFGLTKIVGMIWESIRQIDKHNHIQTDLINKCISLLTDQSRKSARYFDEKQANFQQVSLSMNHEVEKPSSSSSTQLNGDSDHSKQVIRQFVNTIQQEIVAFGVVTQETKKVIDQANEQIQRLNSSVEQIQNATLSIQEIASQAHVLGLNATIEAARSGEAGKGFSAIAGEIKNLSHEVTKTTDSITQHVVHTQKAVQNTLLSIQGVQEIMNAMTQATDQVIHLVNSQGEVALDMQSDPMSLQHHFEELSQGLKQFDFAGEAPEPGKNDSTHLDESLGQKPQEHR